jgi:excisionase family DNA binding protein
VSRVPRDPHWEKTKGRDTLKTSDEVTAPNWSGRLDLNQRPLAPQLDTGRSAGVVPGGTGEQGLEIIESTEPTDTWNGTDTTPDQRRLVPPVSPHAAVPLEQLLTVREAAEYLRVCRATVYKLCAAGALSHVCISNAIRLTRADLAEFIAERRLR